MRFCTFLLLAGCLAVNGANLPWRTSLEVCWNDVRCPRAMTCSHGGDWSLDFPYSSHPAFIRAFDKGAEAIKGDFRVSRDGIGTITHSSPILWYESFECAGRRIEEMTAAEITTCRMALSNFTFMTAPQLLAWAENRIITMLCVKSSRDIARAVTTIIEAGAQTRAFLEIKTNEMLSVVMTVPRWNEVYYLPEMMSLDDVNRMLAAPRELLARCIMFELAPSWPNWPTNVSQLLATRVRSRGFRSFAATERILPSVENHLMLYATGFDVTYTYGLDNAVRARVATNTQRGVSPP